MALNGDHPILRLAAQGMRIRPPEKQVQPRGRAVSDLILFHLCPRNAHFFSEGRFPSHTQPAVVGIILHRTIKHLHGRYLAAQLRGENWIPDEQTVLEECQVVAKATRLQGLPQLSLEQEERLQQMLSTFHRLEATWLYPRIKAAEVPLSWVWEQAPGGPILLEGTVDVVFLQEEHGPSSIALWDYKTGTAPQKGSPELRSYEQQMKLYAFLYRRCFGVSPQETALYFMRELVKKTPLSARPLRALHQVPVTENDDDDILEWLGDVLVKEVECEKQNLWEAPPAGEVPRQICQSCGVQWSCDSLKPPFPWEPGGETDDEQDPLEL